MSEDNERDTERREHFERSDRRDDSFTRITNILILATLVIMTGFLALLYFKMGSTAPQAQPATVVQPAPATPEPQATKPAMSSPVAAAPVRRASSSGSQQRNYTQPSAPAVAPPPPVVSQVPVQTVADATQHAAAPQPALVTPPAPQPISSATAPEPPRSVIHTIPAGTILTVRMIDRLQSDRNRTGDRFTASLEEPLYANGLLVVPRGATVEGHVVDTQDAGRVSGVAQISIQLDKIMVNGRSIDLITDSVAQRGETSRGSDAAKVGTGAAIGAVIGAISGGGKGAAIGAATGAGAGTAGVLMTRGKPAVIEPEARLNFQLRAPIQIEGSTQGAMYSDAQTTSRDGDWDADRPVLRRRNQVRYQ